MTTLSNNNFEINGVISTDKSVLQNINTLCKAAGCWMTYDIAEGRWSVIINQAGNPIVTFDDSTIIGGINVSGTGINELYNQGTIEFPHKDLRDQTDYIDLELPSADRYANELDNRLNISLDCINNPIQAQYILNSELKQSRVDKVIQFRTDYSYIGLKAGDLIAVTSSMYGYNEKVFRITKLQEDDADALNISITALEYDADVYSTAGLIRKIRDKKTGIIPKSTNTAIKAIDNQSSLKLDLTDAAKALGLSLFFIPATGASGYQAGTYYLDSGGTKVQIAASEVVISWTYPDGTDLDIRCRIASPDVGQDTIQEYLGFLDFDGTGSVPVDTDGDGVDDYFQFPNPSLRYWPIGSTGGTGGTAYLEWGGDNTGVGGDPNAVESVRIDIDRLKTVFPSKRYFVIECRGNWYSARGAKPVQLVATLYEGGTTSLSGYGFANVGATRSRVLSGVQVYVDSLSAVANAPGDLMGYFVFDTISNEGQFLQQLPPEVSQ